MDLGRLRFCNMNTTGLLQQTISSKVSMDFSDVQGKTVVITGGTTGIGEATAIEFAKYGAKLVICGRNLDGLTDTKDKCLEKGLQSEDVAIVTGDICEEQTLDLIVKTSVDRFGKVDVLFLSAGKVHPKDGSVLDKESHQSLDYYFEVFVKSPYKLTQKLAAELAKTKGSIIFGNSISVQDYVSPFVSSYTCCKAAEDSMAKLFALALANKGVRVNTVRFGAVKTSVADEAIKDKEVIDAFFTNFAACTPLGSTLSTPEEIGRVIVFLGSNQSACITGAVLRTDKGLAMVHPAVDWKQF